MKINQAINETLVFQVLSDDQCEQIYNAALNVMEKTGGRFNNEEALKVFGESDAVVTDENLVRTPTTMAEQALRWHPSKITLTGRNEKNIIKLEKNVGNFGMGFGPAFRHRFEKHDGPISRVEESAKKEINRILGEAEARVARKG